jgi:hypothetical protein
MCYQRRQVVPLPLPRGVHAVVAVGHVDWAEQAAVKRQRISALLGEVQPAHSVHRSQTGGQHNSATMVCRVLLTGTMHAP